MKTPISVIFAILCLTIFLIPQNLNAQFRKKNPFDEKKVEEAIEAFQDLDQLQFYFEEAYGYAVFPSIGKGAIGIGGAFGRGLVYKQEQVIGMAKMSQISIGFQWGGQAYREIVFFEDEAALESFLASELELSAQASVVALDQGASADLAYENGVAIFTRTKGGLMYEASIGGQKFSFFPIEEED